MKFFYPAIISIFIAGCSNSSTVETKNGAAKNTNDATVVNSTLTADGRADENRNIENRPDSSTGDVKIKGSGVIDKDSFESVKKPKIGDIRTAAPINAVPMKNAAPDDSEVSGTMNSEGVPIEIRVFKNNPLLAKTEKILDDPKNPTLKVYLKNGKTVSFPASKISDSVSATADEILIAAGAKPQYAPPVNTSKDASKKRAN